MLVTRISVVACAFAIAAAPTMRLAGAAGQHDHAGAALPEPLDGFALVGAASPSRPRCSAIAWASPST